MTAASFRSFRGAMGAWSQRNQTRLVVSSVISIALLFLAYLFTSTISILPTEASIVIHAGTLVLIGFIILSVASRGLVPLLICILGVVLIHNAVTFPLYAEPETIEGNFGGHKVVWTLYSDQAVSTASAMNFFLGVSMVIFGNIIAFRPTMLFTRNRPSTAAEEWSKYPLWNDNSILAGGLTEKSVPVKSMMTDQERHLLWRYEFVMANIHGSINLVRPEGLVPKDSTKIMRDRTSGLVMGKGRFTGFL